MDMILQDQNIGANLRRLRKRFHLSQADFVREMQLRGSIMSRNTYSKIERGVRNIKVSDLIIIKAMYDIDFSEFFEGMVPDDIPKLGKL